MQIKCMRGSMILQELKRNECSCFGKNDCDDRKIPDLDVLLNGPGQLIIPTMPESILNFT